MIPPISTLTPRQRHLLLQPLRKSPGLFWGLLALGLLMALLEACSVFTVLPLAGSLLSQTASPLSRWWLILAVLMALRSAAVLTHARLSARASAEATYEAQTAVLRAYASASDAVLLDMPGGRLAQRLYRGAASAGTIVLRLPQLAAEAVRAAALVGTLFWLDFRVAVGLCLAGAALWQLFSRTLFARAYAIGHARSMAQVQQGILLSEIIGGARQLRLAGVLGYWRERFAQASRDFCRHHAADIALQALPRVWFEAGAAALILGWMLVAMWQGPARESLSLPLLAAVVVGAGKLMPCLAALGRHHLEILGSLPAVEAMEDFIESESCLPAPGARRLCEGLRSQLRLEGVRFTYPGRTELFKGVDLQIPAGRCVAISGPYGCGKTTLLGLLLGLYEPSGGKILLDGRPLQEYDLPSWWKRVGIVHQNEFLFHGTVAENILLGRQGYGREAVEQAARLVGAHAFISALLQGYDTVVGERGLRLSGGQRLLVFWARALLTDPQVLALDEPTHGLDPQAQEQLAEVLRRLSAGRTVVLATHRPEWAHWADAVFLFQEGRLSAEAPRRYAA